MLERLKRLPVSVSRAAGRLLRRVTRIAIVASIAATVVIALDALFLGDDDGRDEES